MVNTHDRILHAARDLYLEAGFAGLTMRAVAQRVGMTATALYRHFDNKEALLTTLVDEGYRLFGAGQMRAAEAASPLERMQAAGRAYVDFALRNPDYYRLMFITPPTLGGLSLPQHVRDRSRAVYRSLVDRVRECIAAGLFPPGLDPEAAAYAIWATSHGLVSLYLAGKWEGSDKAFRETFARAQGWLARGYLNRS